MNWASLNKNINPYGVGEIQVQTVIFLLLIAGILLGFFYLFKRYVVPFLGSRKSIRKAKVVVYRIEVICWILFVIFGLYQLLSDSLYITVALLLVVILAGRNFWRDLFAGIAFRLENRFQLRDPIRYENYSGMIHKIGRRNIQIKTDKEELVTVPFRKLSSAVIVKRQAKGKLHSEQLNLHLGEKHIEDVKPKIEEWLYQCPWAVVHETVPPKVIGAGLIQLTVYAIDRESIHKTEKFLQQRIKKM